MQFILISAWQYLTAR